MSLKYRLLCIGRRAQDPLVDATEAYAKRLMHYAPFELIRLRESDKAREAADLMSRLHAQDFVVALDEQGAPVTTMALADHVRCWQQKGIAQVVFIVGGADGLQKNIRDRAQRTWALSALTLPHRAAQMILVEQLYRIHTILHGGKYHRA